MLGPWASRRSTETSEASPLKGYRWRLVCFTKRGSWSAFSQEMKMPLDTVSELWENTPPQRAHKSSPPKPNHNTQPKTTMKNETPMQLHEIREARIPVALLRGITLYGPASRPFVYATSKDSAVLSRLTAHILLQVGGKAEVRRSLGGAYATVALPSCVRIVVEG